jgi:type I restriction enzyme M protein
MNSSALIQKVWNFCHTLRDDGVGYGDYLEQLTYLLFLKLVHTNITPNKSASLIHPPSSAADAER